MRLNMPVTSKEHELHPGIQIVSKTDLKGIITYVNHDFTEISGYSAAELIGAPHNIVRHPDMPPAAFKDLWDTLKKEHPWSGIVKNRCKNGDCYWVEANVTPLREGGRVTGYMSVRRRPSREQVAAAAALYKRMLENPAQSISLLTKLKSWWKQVGIGPRVWGSSLALWAASLSCLISTKPPLVDILTKGGILLAIAAILSWYLSDRLRTPLIRSALLLDRLAEGYYDNPIDTSYQDEAGQLLLKLKALQIKFGFDLNHAQRIAEESQRVKTTVDSISTKVIIADQDGVIVYANPALQKMLEESAGAIRKELPDFDPASLVGSNIDKFHSNPSHQHRLLEALSGPHHATIHVGERIFTLVVNPVFSSDSGKRLGSVLEWNDITSLRQVQVDLEDLISRARDGDLSAKLELKGREGFFRDLGEGINSLLATIGKAVGSIDEALARITRGDLTTSINSDDQGAFGAICANANATMHSLATLVSSIKEAAGAIANDAQAIGSGHGNLARRTEQQAAALKQTAAALEQLTATIRQNAANAAQADSMMKDARAVAEEGQALTNKVVATMKILQESSARISEITSVIDGIAFQTNILALNAAVEAARAGDQGRGFAVVAAEVRALASRSAAAAQQIKSLIEDSTNKVRAGSQQAGQAGQTVNNITASIQRAASLMSEISAASHEQSLGIEQIHQAMNQMDEGTQQNSALVEQASAATTSLNGQAEQLLASIEVFKLPDSSEEVERLSAAQAALTASHQHNGERAIAALPTPSTSGDGANLDFTSARSMHMAWREKLRSFLDGSLQLNSQQISSPRECQLGRWMYGHGLNMYSNLPEMKTLEDTHARMHASIKQVVELRENGDNGGAHNEYSKFMRLSREVVELLRRLERVTSTH